MAHRRRPLRIEADGGEVVGLDVKADGEWRRVLPGFKAEAYVPALGDKIVIEPAITERDRAAAQSIVARAHYLNPRPGGHMLIARIRDAKTRKRMREAHWAGLQPPLPASDACEAFGGVGDVVGALIVERLFHGNPKGRSEIYQQVQQKPPKTPPPGKTHGFLHKVVYGLGLYWISRVAVDAPYQRTGIGEILCDAAREVVADRMPEAGRFVELIRRMRVSEFDRIVAGGPDFLTGDSKIFKVKLPYQIAPHFLSRLPAGAGGAADEPMCLAYYFATAGKMVLKPRTKG